MFKQVKLYAVAYFLYYDGEVEEDIHLFNDYDRAEAFIESEAKELFENIKYSCGKEEIELRFGFFHTEIVSKTTGKVIATLNLHEQIYEEAEGSAEGT